MAATPTMQTWPVSDATRSLPYYGRLMFAQSWEDPECDLRALRPAAGETIVGVTSGGDNVLGLLLSDPAAIISIDVNPAQTWLVDLKLAAFRMLTHAEMLELFGVRRGPALQLYQRIRGDLPESARRYWDAHGPWFDQGLLTCGDFERYFATLRAVLRWIVGRRRLERLFALAPDEQRAFFEGEWNNRRWRTVLRVVCSKRMLGRRLDPSWFEHAESRGAFGAHFARLAEHVLTELPVRSNYFLAQILLGRYVDETFVPGYLRPEHFNVIRTRLDRLRLVTADISDALAALPARSVDAFALSNVFEYSPPQIFERAKYDIRRAARPDARIALRNLLAPRRLGDDRAFEVDAPLSERLRLADRGFIYSRFEAATIRESDKNGLSTSSVRSIREAGNPRRRTVVLP